MKKKWLIPILALALAAALCGCGKSEAVENAEREIAAIGDVDASSLRAIEEAEAAYDALTDTQRAAVRNYGELEETAGALSRFEVDRAQGALDTAAAENSGYAEADALYQALSAEQKSQITGYDGFAARWEDYKNRPSIELLDTLRGI